MTNVSMLLLLMLQLKIEFITSGSLFEPISLELVTLVLKYPINFEIQLLLKLS